MPREADDRRRRARLQPRANLMTLQFLRAFGARQLGAGPDVRGANALMIGELRVGRLDDIAGLVPGSTIERDLHALFAVLRHADRRGILDAGHGVDDALDVFRKDVEPFGRDDHFFLAAADEEPARRVELADVAGVEPAVFERRARRFGCAVIAGRHVLAAHENLAVGRDLDVDAADRFADRSLARRERMVQRHDRRGLGEPVALDDDKAEPAPERLERRLERRGADDERPELQTEQSMHRAIPPPALRDASLFLRGTRRTSGYRRAT